MHNATAITTGSANQRPNTPCIRLWIDVTFGGLEDSYSDSDGEENFDGFDLEELETSRNAQNNLDDRNYNVLDENSRERGDRVPQNLTFSSQHGLLKDIDNTDSPINIFELFLENDDLEQIANETNKYAAQFLEGKHWKTSLAFKNGERPLSEMKKFFALVIAMGLLTQMDVSEYWTVNPVTATPFFPSVMSRDRFLLLLTFIHLNDNKEYILRGTEGHINPLFKLGPLYHRILTQFRSVYSPHQALAIDESMVAWHDNFSICVYSPDKPVKYGLKAYALCDAENAYCLKF